MQVSCRSITAAEPSQVELDATRRLIKRQCKDGRRRFQGDRAALEQIRSRTLYRCTISIWTTKRIVSHDAYYLYVVYTLCNAVHVCSLKVHIQHARKMRIYDGRCTTEHVNEHTTCTRHNTQHICFAVPNIYLVAKNMRAKHYSYDDISKRRHREDVWDSMETNKKKKKKRERAKKMVAPTICVQMGNKFELYKQNILWKVYTYYVEVELLFTTQLI